MLEKFIEFDPASYHQHLDGDVRHVIPLNDVAYHSTENCPCGADSIEINGKQIAVLHRAFDKREFLEEIPLVEYAEALEMRREFVSNAASLAKDGKIKPEVARFMQTKLDSILQETFRTN